MQFTVSIADVPIVVLVDSGSTSSFLSQRIADQLQHLNLQAASHRVQIANGGIMQCSAVAVDCSWTMASQSFTHSLQILPLHSYDLILGMDWLEEFSPMKVDWKHKWMQIPVGSSSVMLNAAPDYYSSDVVF